jgi:transcriptional regulator with XRE-family HTH domain
MSIGKKIKQFRELRNYTQEFMATSLGLSQTGYGKIERDSTALSINRLQQIAKVLEVDYKQILEFDEKNILSTKNAIVINQEDINNKTIFEKLIELKGDIDDLRKQFKS